MKFPSPYGEPKQNLIEEEHRTSEARAAAVDAILIYLLPLIEGSSTAALSCIGTAQTKEIEIQALDLEEIRWRALYSYNRKQLRQSA